MMPSDFDSRQQVEGFAELVSDPNRYVFGFGMDAYGLWRNLPAIYALKE